MKKLALALVCLVSVAFFASCTQEGKPSIAVLQEEGFVTDGAVVDLDEEVNYGFMCAANVTTGKKLAQLIVSVDNDPILTDTVDLTGLDEYTYKASITYMADRDSIIGESVITAVVTDAAGQFETATITLKINQPDQPLMGRAIEWKREGSNVVSAEEMAQHGLQWTGSYKEVFATIKPLSNAKLYVVDGDDFANITTVGQKAAYFANLIETGTAVESYRKITTNNSADYNDMLCVVDGEGDYHMVLIKHADIQPVYSNGSYLRTDITITGELK